MEPDLIIQRFSNPHFSTFMDVGIKEGRIVCLNEHRPDSLSGGNIIEAHGRVLLPGFIEPHIHLDKAYLLNQMKEEALTVQQAMASTLELKRTFTKEDIESRSVQVIRQAIAHGVTHMRCHVEIDPIVKLIGLEVMLELKKRYHNALTLQIVAFPQEGIIKQSGTEELLRTALQLGADVVGGITYQDPNLEEHLSIIFKLARIFNKPLDLHVDFSDDPQMLAILTIIQMTHEHGMQGRVSVGHLTSLGSLPYEQAKEICKSIADAGIHVMCLPATDLYLNGRGDDHRPRRGLTPVSLLLEQGVNVIFGSNNIQNPFTPFGTADPLDTGLLLAQTAYMGSKQDVVTIAEMATTRAAQALQIDHYGLQVGAYADLVLCDAFDLRSVVYERAPRLYVWKKGKLVASTMKQTTFYHENVALDERKVGS
ncbi:amidohydrolase family protein [Paenibacillus andongensis]|uniref:amidohydrolase family protein n=1 Tax=Paenibacillus andongensis TaxID=2975482 RepID=UPI0021BB4C6B|nr:amidohydrolase family protein [Paenibacillus andongensis]